MIVVGLDPSLAAFGMALVDCEQMKLLAAATVITPSKWNRAARLLSIRTGVRDLAYEWSKVTAIDKIAVEGGFMGRGAQVSLGIAEARGAALSSFKTVEYLSPKTAKKAVVGNGNASKEQVLEAVMELLGCQTITLDEADAAAVALAASGYRREK